MTRNSKLFAAAMSVSLFTLPGAVRATQLFQDNFSNDTATFAYPDASTGHAPGTPSGPGSWSYNYSNYEMIQAGVITNTLPGGGTGGADGNPNYMAIQRSGGVGWAAADFASPAGTSGTLSAQWDMYDVGPGKNFQIFLSDAAGSSAPFGNNGPLIEASYFSPANSGDMELGAITPSGYNDMGGFPNNAWVHMDMEVNLSAQTYQFFVNGTLQVINGTGQSTFQYLQPTGPLESLDFYGASDAGETIDVDNISVVDTPAGGPPQWVPNGSGDWNVKTNWNGGVVPNGVDAEADFFGAITANHTVYTDVPVTAGTLNFNNAFTYVVTGAGSLTLQASTGNAQVIVQQGTQELNLPTTIASNTVFNVSAGANLLVANPLTINSGESLTQTGGGTVTYQSIINVGSSASIAFANSTHAHQLSLASGATATLGGPVLEVDSLSNLGTVNVENNTLLINYGSGGDPIASVISEIKSGANVNAITGLATWTGAGITSTNAAANSGSYGLAYADSADPNNPAGLAPGTIEVTYTLLGDANLDYKVNGTDFNILAANFNTGGDSWDQGDFTYDGKVNGTDFNLLASNFNQGASQAGEMAALDAFAEANGLSLNSVPEPATLGLIASATIGLLGRRNRRSASK